MDLGPNGYLVEVYEVGTLKRLLEARKGDRFFEDVSEKPDIRVGEFGLYAGDLFWVRHFASVCNCNSTARVIILAYVTLCVQLAH